MLMIKIQFYRMAEVDLEIEGLIKIIEDDRSSSLIPDLTC